MPFPFGSYLVSDDDSFCAALAFDPACLANYDFAGTSPPDTVDACDIGRMIGSRMVGMTSIEAAELIRLGPSAPWHAVPIDARLEDAAPNSNLLAAAEALRAHFESIHRVKAAKSTKLLAMKRPTLYPVIDSRVVTVYNAAAAQMTGMRYPNFVAIRNDVLDPATNLALTTLRASLLKRGTPMRAALLNSRASGFGTSYSGSAGNRWVRRQLHPHGPPSSAGDIGIHNLARAGAQQSQLIRSILGAFLRAAPSVTMAAWRQQVGDSLW